MNPALDPNGSPLRIAIEEERHDTRDSLSRHDRLAPRRSHGLGNVLRDTVGRTPGVGDGCLFGWVGGQRLLGSVIGGPSKPFNQRPRGDVGVYSVMTVVITINYHVGARADEPNWFAWGPGATDGAACGNDDPGVPTDRSLTDRWRAEAFIETSVAPPTFTEEPEKTMI